MKPENYAKNLIALCKKGTDIKTLSQALWFELQRTNRYKDLPKILDALETEAAKEEGVELVKIYSSNKLGEEELSSIKTKLDKKYGRKFFPKNFIKKNITGIVAQSENIILDLSLEGKISQLKQKINNY